MKIIGVFIVLFTFNIGFGQDTSDVYRLKNMPYMKEVSNVRCEAREKTDREKLICLNFEFQEVDALMNKKLVRLLEAVSKSKKEEIIAEQNSWLKNRRNQSYSIAQGAKGDLFGMYYLKKMSLMTLNRMEELDKLYWELE